MQFLISFLISFFLIIASSGYVFSQDEPYIDGFSEVCMAASTGDGSSSWGGHQCSVVRTSEGKTFTIYTIEGSSGLNRKFRLVMKTPESWEIVAEGDSGREPAQVLRGRDDRIFVVCWPNGAPKLWSNDPGGLIFTSTDIPGDWDPGNNWPYFSTGIDQQGKLFLLTSGGGKPGYFKIAYRDPATGNWSAVKKIDLDYRYCYTYTIPDTEKGVFLGSLRDVRRSDLGYTQPAGAFDYVFNAVKTWVARDFPKNFTETLICEEIPTTAFPKPNVSLNYNGDVYLDSYGRIHVLTPVSGASTGGTTRLIHHILDGSEVITSVLLPAEIRNGRMIQNEAGKFFIISFDSKNIYVYPAFDANGLELERAVTLDLEGHVVRYSNLHVAAPRCGVPLSNEVDIVFPSDDSGEKWIYFKLHLPIFGPEDTTLLQKPVFEVYPNPARQSFHVKGLNEETQLTIFDLAGRKIHHELITTSEIHIWQLPPGIYILHFEQKNGSIYRKLVKI